MQIYLYISKILRIFAADFDLQIVDKFRFGK